MKKTIRAIKKIIFRLTLVKNNYCCLCESNVGGFLPYGGGWKSAPPLMRALNIIGSDLDNFGCPICLAHDRERHLWLYLKASGLLTEMTNASILHFAPEQQLSQRLVIQKPNRYIKADLYPTSSDIQKIDLLAMPYGNEEFDFLIANHVLEHVADVQQALSEINRVLKPDGWAIMQTPYSATLLHTWEDAGIQTKYQRLAAYGQEDHIRLYGQDIFTLIEKSGFRSHQKTHEMLLHDKPATYYGVNSQEPFMLFQKIRHVK